MFILAIMKLCNVFRQAMVGMLVLNSKMQYLVDMLITTLRTQKSNLLKSLNMKIKFLLIIPLFIFLLSCNQKDNHFDKKDFKNAVTLSLTDSAFTSLLNYFYKDSLRSLKTQWYLYGNVMINDTLKAGSHIYTFGKTKDYHYSDSTILYKLTYNDQTSSTIILENHPSKVNKVVGRFNFKFSDNKWQLASKKSGLVDGKF
jgi:hypothetical protein